MKCECAAMENLSEDGFESSEQFWDWSTCSSEHWDEDPRDSSGFGDWTSFKEGLSEESESTDLSHEGRTSGYEHKVERGDEAWIVIHDCFYVEEMVRDTDMVDVLPLSQLLHNSTHTPPLPAVLLRKGASFYHSLLSEPKTQSTTDPKPNLHSHNQLTDTLQLKQSKTLQNTDLPQLELEKPESSSAALVQTKNTGSPHLEFEKPESSSAALIQTKLTAPTWCQNSPGFFYQISRQWLSQNSLRQDH